MTYEKSLAQRFQAVGNYLDSIEYNLAEQTLEIIILDYRDPSLKKIAARMRFNGILYFTEHIDYIEYDAYEIILRLNEYNKDKGTEYELCTDKRNFIFYSEFDPVLEIA